MKPSVSRATWWELVHFPLDPRDERPLFQQLYLVLRKAIVAGTLAPGSRLPSSRELAARLGISRTSVIAAYDQLLAEGYVAGRRGSGTYVSEDVPVATPAKAGRPAMRKAAAVQAISAAGQRYARFGADLSLPGRQPFTTGCCLVDARTVEAWRRIGSEQMRHFDPANLAYADPGGEEALRQQVAEYLRAARAVQCEPEQIIITSGAQQAIDLSVRILLEPGDAVWVEDPGYLASRAALTAQGMQVTGVPVDEAGLMVEQGVAAAPGARAVYITPSHQYPTGAVMSMARRLELLGWAARNGAWIIEDDYDSEFRYDGPPLASLQGLDRHGCVIYVGTLSKVMFPGLRLGFAVVPPRLADAFRGARFLSDRSPPVLLQAMAAEFMRRGFLTSHIRRVRQQYREARDVVIEALGRQLGDLVETEKPGCGIQLVTHFRVPVSDLAIAEAAARHGVTVRPVSPHYLQVAPRQGLVLGYSGFDSHSLRSAAAALGRAVRSVVPSR